jgi:hypothetical protein
MRSRSTLFLFAFLLLITSLAGAAVPAGISAPATDTASSSEDPSCNPLLEKLGISSPQDTATLICGSCSLAPCQGAVYNTICQGGTVPKRCINVYGFQCTTGGPKCQCWSGPLP